MRNRKKKPRTPLSHQQIGRLGGLARARNLSAEARSQASRKAVLALWTKIRAGAFVTKDDPAE